MTKNELRDKVDELLAQVEDDANLRTLEVWRTSGHIVVVESTFADTDDGEVVVSGTENVRYPLHFSWRETT